MNTGRGTQSLVAVSAFVLELSIDKENAFRSSSYNGALANTAVTDLVRCIVPDTPLPSV